MKFGILVDVKSRDELDELRRGLDNPVVRQFVRIMGMPTLRGEPAHALCGPRCFLEFIDALARADAARERAIADADEPKRPDAEG